MRPTTTSIKHLRTRRGPVALRSAARDPKAQSDTLKRHQRGKSPSAGGRRGGALAVELPNECQIYLSNRINKKGSRTYQPSSALRWAMVASAWSAETKLQDTEWPALRVHILPVGRWTCAQAPSLAASSSIAELCISGVSNGSAARVGDSERTVLRITNSDPTPLACERASTPNWGLP